mmetsp:Transcript_29856/g.26405  ORF Transcript_29856/g.26405 Transcript_29856/m.26405 type:complete len:111 (+) Transcript_29856:2-334(+)
MSTNYKKAPLTNSHIVSAQNKLKKKIYFIPIHNTSKFNTNNKIRNNKMYNSKEREDFSYQFKEHYQSIRDRSGSKSNTIKTNRDQSAPRSKHQKSKSIMSLIKKNLLFTK